MVDASNPPISLVCQAKSQSRFKWPWISFILKRNVSLLRDSVYFGNDSHGEIKGYQWQPINLVPILLLLSLANST